MLDEITHTIEQLRSEFEALAVRGLRAAGRDDLARLRAAAEEFERIGAMHLSERITTLIAGIEAGDGTAAAALMRAQTSLRLFDRVLTLEVADAALGAIHQEITAPEGGDESLNEDEFDDADEADDEDATDEEEE